MFYIFIAFVRQALSTKSGFLFSQKNNILCESELGYLNLFNTFLASNDENKIKFVVKVQLNYFLNKR